MAFSLIHAPSVPASIKRIRSKARTVSSKISPMAQFCESKPEYFVFTSTEERGMSDDDSVNSIDIPIHIKRKCCPCGKKLWSRWREQVILFVQSQPHRNVLYRDDWIANLICEYLMLCYEHWACDGYSSDVRCTIFITIKCPELALHYIYSHIVII